MGEFPEEMVVEVEEVGRTTCNAFSMYIKTTTMYDHVFSCRVAYVLAFLQELHRPCHSHYTIIIYTPQLDRGIIIPNSVYC